MFLVGFIAEVLGGTKEDSLSKATNFMAKHSDADLIITNLPGLKFGSVNVYLNSHRSIKDFVQKEVEYSTKDIMRGAVTNFDMGFLDIGGREGMKNRSVFTEFFIYENIQALYEPMYTIMDRNMKEFVKKSHISTKNFTQINIRDFIYTVITDWSSLLLFGYDSASELNIDLEKYPNITNRKSFSGFFKNKKQENIIKIISLFVEVSINLLYDPLNFILEGWPFC